VAAPSSSWEPPVSSESKSDDAPPAPKTGD
jgi:hypothetical protein